MRATEFLTELANRPYKVYKSISKPYLDQYMFETDQDLVYVVNIIPTNDPGKPNGIDVGFAIKDVANRRYVSDISGTGDAYRVFATVREVIQKYINSDTPPEFIKFSGKSEDSSRVSLYDRIASTAGRWFKNYQLVSRSEVKDGDHVYILQRQQ